MDEVRIVIKQEHSDALKHQRPSRHQSGASMIEFLIVAPALLFLGLGTVQAGLIFHGKTVLNYATFEAARTGATNNAQVAPMRRELGTRLAPMQGGDGEQDKALLAIAKSRVLVNDPLATRIEIHQTREKRGSEQITLRDANLLKIKVTHGFDLKIPFVADALLKTMTLIDPENIGFYSRGKFPLSSVATVRMQSEAWEDAIF